MDVWHNKTQYELDSKMIYNSTSFINYKYVSKGMNYINTYDGEIKYFSYNNDKIEFTYKSEEMKKNSYDFNEF